jgi:hypothetical protein
MANISLAFWHWFNAAAISFAVVSVAPGKWCSVFLYL